jgi:hypothetical protein
VPNKFIPLSARLPQVRYLWRTYVSWGKGTVRVSYWFVPVPTNSEWCLHKGLKYTKLGSSFTLTWLSKARRNKVSINILSVSKGTRFHVSTHVVTFRARVNGCADLSSLLQYCASKQDQWVGSWESPRNFTLGVTCIYQRLRPDTGWVVFTIRSC